MVLLPTACKTEGEELAVWLEITTADGKSLSDTTIESSPQGEVIEITIASNTAWRISTSAEWIVPQQSSGEGSQGVMLEVGTTTQSRSGVVVVQLAEAEQVRRSFNIVQHAEGPEGPEGPEEPEDNEGADDNGGSEGSGDNEGSSDSGNENGSEDEGSSDDIVMTPDGTDDEGSSGGSDGADNEDGADNDGSNDDNTDNSDSSPDDDIVMTPDNPSDSGDTDDSEGNGETDNGESKEDDAEDSDGGNDSTGTEGSDDKEDSEDNNDPNNPDNNQGDNEGNGNGDNDNNNEDNNNNNEDNGSNNGGEGGNGNEDNNGNDTPAGDYTLIDHVGELAAGEYFIGGYQDGVLHLATEGMTVGHCNTTPYTLSADFSLTPAADATATTIHLEPSDEANGYYIRFSTQGYLTATAAGAGKLTFSNSRSHFWRFANHPDGGFILTQSGDIDVKLIISPHARINALLRSVAGEEDGNAVLLFKRNNP